MISPAVAALADSAFVLPASLLVLVYLGVLREWRPALAFVASLFAVALGTVVLKLLFHACGHAITEARVVSPSGHASLGTMFYGALAAMLARGRSGRGAALLAAGTLLLLVAVGISRVRTGAHTTAEVLIGYGIGGCALLLFIVLRGRERRPLPLAPVAAGFAAVLLLLWGNHFTLERSIARYAREMASALDVCAPPAGAPAWRFSSDRR